MNEQHTPEMLDMVAVYALGGIDATTGECAAVQAHLAECAICQAEYRQASAASAAVGRAAAQNPPAALRDRILASVSANVTPLALRRRVRWVWPTAAAAAVLIAIGAWWNTHHVPAQSWALNCTPAAQPCHIQGSLTAEPAGLRLQMHGLAALPPGKQYQAWMIMPNAAPKPEPAFSASANGDGDVMIPEAVAKGAIVAVTVEPAGGSRHPTTKPFLTSTIE
jgi:anti-sigma-K factor RskA